MELICSSALLTLKLHSETSPVGIPEFLKKNYSGSYCSPNHIPKHDCS